MAALPRTLTCGRGTGVWHARICQGGAGVGAVGAADRGAVPVVKCVRGQCPGCAGGIRVADGAVGSIIGGAHLLIHSAGWMHGGLTASYEKLILDGEMLG